MQKEPMDVSASASSVSSSSSLNESVSGEYSASDNEPEMTHLVQREAAPNEKRRKIDESLVQVQASTTEVRRRIAAFMESKKAEVSDANTREFCFDLPGSENEYSCARVDSVFVGRVGSSSHVRVSRVVNTQGPQTQAYASETDSKRDSLTLFRSSVEERLANAEHHLNINNDAKADLFTRLKSVEEKILFLSGLSPEYFESGRVPEPKRKQVLRPKSPPKDLSPTKLKTEFDSISEIDERIHTIRTKLKERKATPLY